MSWGWRIFVLYTLFVAMTLGMVLYMSRFEVNLVAKDYYRQEIGYQAQIDKMKNVSALSEAPDVALDPDSRTLIVKFPPEHGGAELKGSITLFRPSDSRMDRHLPVQIGADGKQIISVDGLAKGLWRVKVDWQADGLEFYFEDKVMVE